MNTTANPQLPQYADTRAVQAAEIVAITGPSEGQPLMFRLTLALPDGSKVEQPVHSGYIERHKPQVGGYFVRNAEGYARYLTAEVFDEHFARLPAPRVLTPEEVDTYALYAGLQWSADEIAAMQQTGRAPLRLNRINVPKPLPDIELLAGQVWNETDFNTRRGNLRAAAERFLMPQAEAVRHPIIPPGSQCADAGATPDEKRCGRCLTWHTPEAIAEVGGMCPTCMGTFKAELAS